MRQKKTETSRKKVMFYTKKKMKIWRVWTRKKLSFSGWHLRIAMISPFFSITLIFFVFRLSTDGYRALKLIKIKVIFLHHCSTVEMIITERLVRICGKCKRKRRTTECRKWWEKKGHIFIKLLLSRSDEKKALKADDFPLFFSLFRFRFFLFRFCFHQRRVV